MASMASALPIPFRKSLLMAGPTPVYAFPSKSGGGATVRTMGSPNRSEKSQSRWSSPGTDMTAPVP